MDEINGAQIGGLVRWLVGAITAYGIGKGWLSSGVALDIIGLSGVIAMGVWSYFSNKTASLVAQAADSPDVKKIVTTPSLAISIPSQKVVANA